MQSQTDMYKLTFTTIAPEAGNKRKNKGKIKDCSYLFLLVINSFVTVCLLVAVVTGSRRIEAIVGVLVILLFSLFVV